MQYQKNKRVASLDLIKILAMFGVLFLHTLLAFTKRPDLVHAKIWWMLEPFAVLSGFAVPLFFLTSGYLTLGKQIDLKTNLNRTITKLGIPLLTFIFLSSFYLYFVRSFHQYNLLQVIYSSVVGIMSSQLWFLVYLLVFRLFQPLWQLLFEKGNKAVGNYLLLILLSLFFVASFGESPGGQGTILSLLGALFFYLGGGAIKMQWLPTIKKEKLIAIVLLAIPLFIGKDFLETHLGFVSIPLNSLATLLSVFTTLALFILISSVRSLPYAKAISWLAALSFGVYLWQETVVRFRMDILKFEYDSAGLSPYVYCALNFAFVFLASLFLTWLMSVIPKVKAAVGFAD